MLYDKMTYELQTREHAFHYGFSSFYNGLKIVVDKIAKCPKFVLDEQATYTIESLGDSRPSQFVAGLNLCRLPYPTIWIEFPFAARSKYRVTTDPKRYEHSDIAPEPKTVGFLMERMDKYPGGENKIAVTLAWNHADGSVNISMFGMLMDLDASVKRSTITEIPDSVRKDLLERHPVSWMAQYAWADKEVFAHLELEARIVSAFCPYSDEYRLDCCKPLKSIPGAVEAFEKQMLFDIQGEWRTVLSFLMAINSKNFIGYKDVDRSKISKNRVKRGKPPAPDYKEIVLKLSKVQYNRLNFNKARGLPDNSIDVRAHLKVRKTGIFLWNEHKRYKELPDKPPPIYKVKP